MRVLFAVWLAIAGWMLPAAAQAIDDPAALVAAYEKTQGQERILAFTSDVTVAPSGDYDVTETIRVVSLADRIKHGLERDFPTSYRNRLGQKSRVSFDVLAVSRDGRPEHYELIDLDNGVRVRIGEAETLLSPGEHVYVIHYRTSRQIGYRDGYDEIYWNVTGNGWVFPIDMAEARITLPSPARFGERAVYTGPDGSTAHDAAVVEERPGFIHFRTTAPLDSYSGLTVAAAFPKGVLETPSRARRFGWWLSDWGPLVAGLVALAALLGYYFYAWLRAGRGPRRGTIVPIFAPPDDLSAAACRYIRRMGDDNRGFTAAIIDLAVRGHIGITREDGGWLSRDRTTLERRQGGRPAPAPEIAMRDTLLSSASSRIELKQDNHGTLQAARAKLAKGLEDAYSGRLFVRNGVWAVVGLLAIPAAILLVTTFALLVHQGDVATGVLTMPLLGGLSLLAVWGCHKLTQGKGCVVILAWLGLIAAVMIAFMCTFGSVGLALSDGAWPVLLPLAALPLAITAFRWMYAPTVEGRAVTDRIEGFRHYLGITEEERLDALHPPEKTPELFERYLPYAIALDVENRWADKFAAALAAAAAAGTVAHTASWYSGGGNVWDDPGGFASSVGSSLASTISSASTSPSSSSSGGSSGGGSSGGGGGGGGGGGW
jgi:uncharacterized membrane protein YgcG